MSNTGILIYWEVKNMRKLPSSIDIDSLLNSIVPPSKDNKLKKNAIDLYDRVLEASNEYICFPSFKQLEKLIILSAQYQYEYMEVNLSVIKNLYNDLDETIDDDLLKKVHRKIIEIYY